MRYWKRNRIVDSFATFYYVNGRLPYTGWHLFVPDGEIPWVIQGEKLSLKELFEKIFRIKLNGLVCGPFLSALLLFFTGKESRVKNFLAELFRNLTVEVLSCDNESVFEYHVLADLCAESNVKIANSIFANHERARLDMKKQDEDINKKHDFFDDDDDDDEDDDDIIRISQMMFQLSKKVISPVMFRSNKKVIMKLTIEKQFPTHPQKGKETMKLMKKIY